MKTTILLITTFLLLMGHALATDVHTVTVRYKQNGVWRTHHYQPSSTHTITPDQGTSVTLGITRTQDAETPALFYINDLNNSQNFSQESSATSVSFPDCAGPLDTQLWASVNNQTGSVTIFVNWLNPPEPDLSVSNVRVNGSINPSGMSFQVGQTVSLRSIVYNNGGTSAGTNRTGFYLKTSEGNTSGSPFDWKQIAGISAGHGANQDTEYTFTASDVGTRYFVIEADYLNQLDEADEDNNVGNFGPFQVVEPASVDLSPLSHDFGNITINECSDDYNFTITNEGGTAASGHVTLVTGTNFTISGGDGNYSLNPGQSKTISIQFCPETAGNKTDHIRVYADDSPSYIAQATLSGISNTPPEPIIGISDEFTFNTYPASGGILVKVIETAGTNMVKKVGFEYTYDLQVNTGSSDVPSIGITVPLPIVSEINEKGLAFLLPPDINDLPEEATNIQDFDNTIILYDENDNRIGSIPFSYSFDWEGMHSREVVLFFHNDEAITGGDANDPNRYFPYHANSPNNVNGKTYKYYNFGEYPVTMLIPPHFGESGDMPQGYRFPVSYNDVNPLLFVHGLTGTFSYQEKHGAVPQNTETQGDQVSYWYQTERIINNYQENGNKKYHAWQFYYPGEDDLRHCGIMLRSAFEHMDMLYQKNENKIGLVAHSMGGLVTMEFITTNSFDYNENKIDKVFLSMSPMHGSSAANLIYHTTNPKYIGLSAAINFDRFAPAYRDMSIGSEFLFNLHNRNWQDHINVDNIITNIGLIDKNYKKQDLKDYYIDYANQVPGVNVNINTFHNEASLHDDGIVSISSSSILDKGIGFIGLLGNHDDGRLGDLLPLVLLPDIIDKYFSQNQEGFQSFCLNNDLVELFVDGNKNIIKPSESSHLNINSLTLNNPEVDARKGMITFKTSDFNDLIALLIRNFNNTRYILDRTLTTDMPPLRLGYFQRNTYNNLDHSFYSFKNKPYRSNNGSAFNFISNSNECLPLLVNNRFGSQEVIGTICRKHMEHQFISLESTSKDGFDPTELTPTKQLIVQDEPGLHEESLFIDDQTSYVEFQLYSQTYEVDNIPFSMVLNAPDNTIIDSTSTNISYVHDYFTGLKKIRIEDPVPGEWIVNGLTDPDSPSDPQIITLGRLVSDIQAESLIEQLGHDIHVPIETQSLVTVPNADQMSMEDLQATIKIFDGTGEEYILTLPEIEVSDNAFTLSNTFSADTTGVHTYIFTITGTYNNVQFERAVYGDFLVEDLTPQLVFPNQDLNVGNRHVNMYMPNYFSCNQCDMESVSFEVGLESSTFDEEDVIFSYSAEEHTLNISVVAESPQAEAVFFVEAWQDDELLVTSTFTITYSSPDVPAHLAANSIGVNSANLTWIPQGQESVWDVIYGPVGFDLDSEGSTLNGITEPFYNLEDLVQGAPYDFYVRAAFGEGDYSQWSWPGTFHTNHIITASSGPNGSLDFEGENEIAHRGDQLFTVIPDTGYHISNVLIDGESVGAVESYLFEDVQQSHTIHAEFAINVYTIDAQPNDEDYGSVTGTGNYEHFENVTLTATPATGYHFVNWTENGAEVSTDATYVFMADAARHFMAHFEPETSVVDLDGQEITLYPNPFNHTFTIQNATQIEQVIMNNLLGQQFLDKKLSGSETETISTGSLPKGVYLVHIIMENGNRKTIKMIKE